MGAARRAPVSNGERHRVLSQRANGRDGGHSSERTPRSDHYDRGPSPHIGHPLSVSPVLNATSVYPIIRQRVPRGTLSAPGYWIARRAGRDTYQTSAPFSLKYRWSGASHASSNSATAMRRSHMRHVTVRNDVPERPCIARESGEGEQNQVGLIPRLEQRELRSRGEAKPFVGLARAYVGFASSLSAISTRTQPDATSPARGPRANQGNGQWVEYCGRLGTLSSTV